jgi:hypothetical protein
LPNAPAQRKPCFGAVKSLESDACQAGPSLKVNAMTEATTTTAPRASAWAGKPVKTLIQGGAGVLAIAVAVQAMAYSPGGDVGLTDHAVRIAAFAALTVWATLTFGLHRRGAAAVTVLAFASFIEWVVLPTRGEGVGSTLVSANLGIVLAYCGLHLYGLSARKV